MRKLYTILLLLALPVFIYAQEPEQETKYLRSKVNKKNNLDFTVTVGGGGTYIPGGISDQWVVPENGLGVLYGFFGDVNAMVKVSKVFGVSASVGKSFTSVRKNYVTEGVPQYSSDQKIDNIPVTLGVRIYLGKTFYFEPQLGYNLMSLDTETSEEHPFGEYQSTDEDKKFTFGGALGLDIRKGNMAFNLAGQFLTSDNQETFGIIQPLSYAGLRLGIGFGTKK